MKLLITLSALVGLCSLSGCAANGAMAPEANREPLRLPQRHLHTPATPQPIAKKAYQCRVGNDPALVQAFARYQRTGKAPNIVTDGFVTFAYNQAQQPIIQTTPFQATVITLAVGEKFTNISSGDPSRWSYAVAVSGQGETTQQHVLVKPCAPELSTNLLIATNQRFYNLGLVSTPTSAPTRRVQFWYPEEGLITPPAPEAVETASETVNTPSSPMPPLNLDYRLTTPGLFARTPDWQPRRVFDDGVHTYLQFPDHLKYRELPVLFVRQGGKNVLVNYRVQSPYWVVDKLFQEAILISGVGQSQQAVIITNQAE